MYDTVHIDEKWFNLFKASTKFYITPNEQLPHQSTTNKRYIGKVMFLTAVAPPRYNFSRKEYFDGKIGIWPIVKFVPAKRSSRNRPAGTLEMKIVDMNRPIYVQLLKEKVFAAIRERWPCICSTRVLF